MTMDFTSNPTPLKSPGGSLFPYYYKNGQLYCIHLGDFGADTAKAVGLLRAETAFLAAQNRALGVWIDFYHTRVNEDVLAALTDLAQTLGPRLPKLALVGGSLAARWKIKRWMRHAALPAIPLRFFRDPEEAKTWLVDERA